MPNTSAGSALVSSLIDSFKFEDAKMPTMPDVAMYIQRALNDDTIDIRQLTALIEREPVLAARLLRVANSPGFRSIQPVERISDAVVRIGFSNTRNMSLMLLKNTFTSRHPLTDIMLEKLWFESLRVASIAYVLAGRLGGVDPNRAMLGGLLYNVGGMLMLTSIDSKVHQINNVDVLNTLLERHASEFGQLLLKSWSMDPELVDVVSHRRHWDRETHNMADLCDLVLVADCSQRYCMALIEKSITDEPSANDAEYGNADEAIILAEMSLEQMLDSDGDGNMVMYSNTDNEISQIPIAMPVWGLGLEDVVNGSRPLPENLLAFGRLQKLHGVGESVEQLLADDGEKLLRTMEIFSH